MHLKDCYTAIGGDYEDICKRFGSETIAEKFVLKFLNDQSFAMLDRALQEKDYETAFRAAHTLKGVCLNLSFTRLFTSASQLTEALRAKDYPEAHRLFPETETNYHQTVKAIQNLCS